MKKLCVDSVNIHPEAAQVPSSIRLYVTTPGLHNGMNAWSKMTAVPKLPYLHISKLKKQEPRKTV